MSPLLCCYDRALRREKPLNNDITALRWNVCLEELLYSPLLSSEDRALRRYNRFNDNCTAPRWNLFSVERLG